MVGLSRDDKIQRLFDAAIDTDKEEEYRGQLPIRCPQRLTVISDGRENVELGGEETEQYPRAVFSLQIQQNRFGFVRRKRRDLDFASFYPVPSICR